MTATWASRFLTRPELYGVALRLLLMPIGACWDLFGYYWISHQWVYHGTLPADQCNGLFLIWPPFYLHAAWLWLIRPLLGPGDPWGEGLAPSPTLTQPWVTPEAVGAFYLQPHLPFVLFLLKAPYVLVECWLIHHLLRHPVGSSAVRRRLAWVLWLNPISLYTVALLGAWDVVPVALLVLSTLLLPRRPVGAGLWLALATAMKLFPAIVSPFLLLVGAKGRSSRMQFGMAALVSFGLWVGIGQWVGVPMLKLLASVPQYGMALAAELSLRYSDDRLYLFLVGSVFLWCHAARFGTVSFFSCVRYGAAVFLLFYSVSFFHPQYMIWGVPFVAICIAQQRRRLWLLVIQAVCLAVYTLQWGPILTTYLFAPLDPNGFMFQRTPMDWLAGFVNPQQLIGVAHSVLAGTSLWMVFDLLRADHRPAEGRGQA